MKTLSLLGQEISPNRVKTWVTYVGLDLVVSPFGSEDYNPNTTGTGHSAASDLWNYEIPIQLNYHQYCRIQLNYHN